MIKYDESTHKTLKIIKKLKIIFKRPRRQKEKRYKEKVKIINKKEIEI